MIKLEKKNCRLCLPVFSMPLVFSKEFTSQYVFFISVIKVLLKVCIFQQLLQNVWRCNLEIVLKSLDYKCYLAFCVQEGRHKLPVCTPMSHFLNFPDIFLLVSRVVVYWAGNGELIVIQGGAFVPNSWEMSHMLYMMMFPRRSVIFSLQMSSRPALPVAVCWLFPHFCFRCIRP